MLVKLQRALARAGAWAVPIVLLASLAACGGSQPAARAEAPTAAQAVTDAQATPRATPRPRPPRIDGMRAVYADELPREAQRTLVLIARGGPFPYSKDGSVFQNRERLLPNKPRGYYSEYTVPTPGEDDRGARRLVVGRGGEVYYTADHYDSFVRVITP